MKKNNFNLGKLFDSNAFVRVFAIVLGIITWAVITITINPNQSITVSNVNVKINVGSSSAAGTLGLSVIEQDITSAGVNVYGKRYKVGNLTSDDFTITADISAVNAPGEYTIPLTAKAKENDEDYSVNSVSPASVKVRFDYLSTVEIPLEADAPNITAKDSFVKDEAYASAEKIKISGPQNDVDKIARAVVTTDKKDTISQTLVTDGKLVLYDEDNNVLELNSLTYEPETFTITVPILKQKTLALKFDYRNAPADFPLDNLKYTMSSSTLKVTASTEAIDNIKELHLGYIDLRTLDIGSRYDFDIVLPSGFKSLEDVSKVTVKFDKTGLSSKRFNINKFNVINAPDEYDVSMVTKSLSNVKIVGGKDVIDKLSSRDLVASIDLLNDAQITQEGQLSVPVQISAADGKFAWAVGEYNVVINAVQK